MNFVQESGLFVDLFFQFDCQCVCVSGHWRYFCVYGMEYAPKAFDDELNEPGTDFDIDIGSIHTNILTRVNEAFSQTGGLVEGGDEDKSFVQQMIPAIGTSVATAVGEVMKSFLKKMPKPTDIVSVDRSPVVQNLQRNLLLMRYDNDRLEKYSRRETVKVVGLKEEGRTPSRRYCVFSKLLVLTSLRLMFVLCMEQATGRGRGSRSWCALFPGRRGRRSCRRRRY